MVLKSCQKKISTSILENYKVLTKEQFYKSEEKISKNNKFSNSSEHIFHVKIGLLRVIQANENSSIAINENETTDESEFPIMDYSTVMLGDEVTVPID